MRKTQTIKVKHTFQKYIIQNKMQFPVETWLVTPDVIALNF